MNFSALVARLRAVLRREPRPDDVPVSLRPPEVYRHSEKRWVTWAEMTEQERRMLGAP